jgi:protein-disulfide isomerase
MKKEDLVSESTTTTSKTLPLALGAAVGVGLIAAIGYTAWSANLKADDTQQAVAQLTDAVTTLVESQSRAQQFSSQEAFQEAVSASIRAHAEEARQAEVDARYAPYEAAAEETPEGQWIYGNLDARFTLVEYADTECGYCKRFHGTPKSIVDGSNGNVNWEYKHLTVLGETSVIQAQAAECIGEQLGNKGFWVAVQEIYDKTGSNGTGAGNLTKLAASVGADESTFQSCMAEGRHRDLIDQETQMARSQGITGTPATIVVDNQTGQMQLLAGAQPAQAFIAAMKGLVARAAEEGEG